MKGAIPTGVMLYGAIGAAFLALYGMLQPQINTVAANQYQDHSTLTAAVENILIIKDDIKDIKRVVYKVAPNWGVNPNAGEATTTP
jgi:hypothetical protein